MKNIFKKIGIITVLTLILSSCNVVSSSNLSSSSSNANTTSSSTALATNVTAINLTTQSSLIQFVGLTSRVLVAATVTGTNIDGVSLEWFVNNEKSTTQDGSTFEFSPTAIGDYIIQARFGSVSSNSINLKVDEPSFTAAAVNALSPSVLEITAVPGVSFSISGMSILSSSNFNLSNSRYTLNLASPMVQGTTYTITMTRSGFKPFVTTYLFDTRVLRVNSITYNGKRVTVNSDNVYTIVKPFDNATLSYNLSLEQNNLEGQSVAVSILTDSPAGITVAPYQQTISLAKGSTIERSYSITRTSPTGLYVHNISVAGRLLAVRVLLVEPQPTISFEDDASFVYGPAGTLNSGTGVYAANATIFAKTDGSLTNVVKPEANGTYVIYKPYNGPAKQFAFKLRADYFTVPTGFPESGNPHVLLAILSGPSGGTMLYGNSIPNVLNTSTQFRSTLTDLLVFGNVDSKTQVGTYTYTFSAGTFSSSSVTKTITVVVREFSPKIEAVVEYGSAPLTANSNGTFTLVKPLPGNEINNTISLRVSYFESPLQFQGIPGVDTLYDPDINTANDVPRFLLNYSVVYNGPLSGISNVSSKIAIELGQTAAAENTVTALGTSTPTFKRFVGTGDSILIDITSDISNLGTLSPTTFPGTHTYTVTIGNLSRVITLIVEEPTPRINLITSSIRYGGTSDGASTLATNVTFNALENKYYVSGPGKFLSLLVRPFGMPSGNYPYTFTRSSPSGSFLSNTNVVALQIRSPYDGTLTFPASPAPGAEMVIAEVLTEVGEYRFIYNINGASRTINIVVLPDPQLKVESLSLNGVDLTTFNGQYYIERSTSSRFLSAIVTPVNVKDTYKYTLSIIADNAEDITAKQDLLLVEGKLYLEITLPGSTNTNSQAFDQRIYYLRLYDGASLVGVVTLIRVNVQDKQ